MRASIIAPASLSIPRSARAAGGQFRKAIQEHYHFKRKVGTDRKGPFFPREPHLLVKRTCRGMINYQSSAGRAAYKRIKAHLGVPKELANLKADTVEAAKREAKAFLTVAELSTWLGRPTQPSVVHATKKEA